MKGSDPSTATLLFFYIFAFIPTSQKWAFILLGPKQGVRPGCICIPGPHQSWKCVRLNHKSWAGRHFKTLSLDELRSPDFNLLSDQEYSEEEEAETIEKYMSKTQTDYGSGVSIPKIDNKDQFELKGQFLKELEKTHLAVRIMRMQMNTLRKFSK
ncbi:hypothetical protein Tco_0655477 [Tanacetum coccineum]|uniref:Uncharacterized protein n=1 Tax=Tanacetum coccineum TaxID=301880 RepID=A0ABQ4X6J3_9ASTR